MRFYSLFLGLCAVLQLAACSPNDNASAPTTTDGDGDPATGDGDGDDEDEGNDENDDDGDDSPGGGPCETPPADSDIDGDGFTKATGDCNECSKQINPGAYDFPGNEYDEDCSGSKAEAGEDACDSNLSMASTAAEDAARAIGLCKFTTESEKSWGVISARYTTATGSGSMLMPTMAGLLPEFGAARPRAGESMLALSSGVARAPGQDGYTDACDPGTPCLFPGLPPGCTDNPGAMEDPLGQDPPAGYPKESSGCGTGGGGGGIFDPSTKIFNQAALELKIRVPTNAKSYAFDSIFYTYEYPNFICSAFNDFFVVFQSPKPADLEDENIVFDSNGDPIGVNAGLLAVCNPDDQVPGAAKTFECEQGTGLLQGTGFGANEATCAQEGGTLEGVGGASTGWLHTTAPVAPNTIITVRFSVWDTGDQILDSTVLVDKWEWSVEEPDVETTPVIL
jgi:hypothetical protein